MFIHVIATLRPIKRQRNWRYEEHVFEINPKIDFLERSHLGSDQLRPHKYLEESVV